MPPGEQRPALCLAARPPVMVRGELETTPASTDSSGTRPPTAATVTCSVVVLGLPAGRS